MKVWISGAEGMLGRWVARAAASAGYVYLATERHQVEIHNRAAVDDFVREYGPDVIINCAGRVERETPAQVLLEANALGPWVLAGAAEWFGKRLVHVSTDCVFSGKPKTVAHKYKVSDLPDPCDMYGRSKLAGEAEGSNVLTVRTSFVGWERGLGAFLRDSAGSIIDGWANAYWNGSTVKVVAEMLVKEAEGDRVGIHHAASAQKVSKAWLLRQLNAGAGLGVKIKDRADPLVDRALEPTIPLPPLDEALEEMCQILK